MTASTVREPTDAAIRSVADRLVDFLATGHGGETLFAADAFGDLSLPQWRTQTTTADELVRVRHRGGHVGGGDVRVERLELGPSWFLMQFAEWWPSGGQRWYAREMVLADVRDGRIVELTVYCTGDWDEERQQRHATTERLQRP